MTSLIGPAVTSLRSASSWTLINTGSAPAHSILSVAPGETLSKNPACSQETFLTDVTSLGVTVNLGESGLANILVPRTNSPSPMIEIE